MKPTTRHFAMQLARRTRFARHLGCANPVVAAPPIGQRCTARQHVARQAVPMPPAPPTPSAMDELNLLLIAQRYRLHELALFEQQLNGFMLAKASSAQRAFSSSELAEVQALVQACMDVRTELAQIAADLILARERAGLAPLTTPVG
jgi:hypothetical protein